MKQTIYNICLTVICSALLFIFFEWFARARFWAPNLFQYNKYYGTTLRPNVEGLWKKEGCAHFKINSNGLRDYEYSYKKPENVYRILILGDSFTTAFQVELGQTFHKVLEQLLNSHDHLSKKVEVINVSQPNYGTAEEYLRLKYDGVKYTPDLVILAFFNGNDFRNNSRELDGNVRPFFFFENGKLQLDDSYQLENLYLESAIGYNHPLRKLSRALSEHSHFYRFLRARLGLVKLQLHNQRANKIRKGKWVPIDYQLFFAHSDERWQVAFALTQSLILEIKKLCDQQGVQFLLVSIPAGEQVYENAQEELMQEYSWIKDWDFEKPEKLFKRLARRYKIEYLELLPIFRRMAQKSTDPFYFRYLGHFTPEGHTLFAHELAKVVLKNNLIPLQVLNKL